MWHRHLLAWQQEVLSLSHQQEETFSCSAVVTGGGSFAVAAGCTVTVTGVSVVPAAAAAAEAVAVIAGQGLGRVVAG